MYSVGELQNIIQKEIELRSRKLHERNPFELYEPIEYTMGMGGKRLRPVLLLLAYNLFDDEISNAIPAAISIEIFHNFTLLHDDIMDNADVRRNRATVHKKYNKNAAILSGDAMAFLSYQYLLESKSDRLKDVIRLFSDTALEVCEGQQYDMDFESRQEVSVNEYLEMIRLKTAVLLACCLKAGVLLANQSDETANQLYEFGINLGLSFQLQDDLLDTFGDQKTFGKKIGGDIVSNKKTFLLINALEMAAESDKLELINWMHRTEFDRQEKVDAVKSIFNKLGIKELAQEKLEYYFQKSQEILNQFSLAESKKQALIKLSYSMLKRKS